MALKLDPFGRLLRSPVSAARPACIVRRGQIRDDERSMTVRGSVQVHQRCATYRMRQVESGRQPPARLPAAVAEPSG